MKTPSCSLLGPRFAASFLTLFIIILSSLPGSASTDFTVGVVNTSAGSEVLLPVDMASTDDPVALQFDLSFDGLALASEPALKGEPTSAHNVLSQVLKDGLQRILIYSQPARSIDDGIILSVPFRILSGTQGIKQLNLLKVVAANQDGQSIQQINVTPGSVNIAGQPPLLTAITITDTGAAQFQLSGIQGVTYRIDASPDLKTWEMLDTVTADQNGFAFTDPDAVSEPQRFYRAVVVQEGLQGQALPVEAPNNSQQN